MMILLLHCAFIFCVVKGAKLLNCPKSELKFQKTIGVNPTPFQNRILLYQGELLEPVTTECIDRCLNMDECLDFVIYYNTSACYWYSESESTPEDIGEEIDINAAWFSKICYNVQDCQTMWIFERVSGATLIGNDRKTLPALVSRAECQHSCLNEKSFACRSAKFRLSFPDNLGICTLSDADRHLLPNSYRASSFDEEYFENQCVTVTKEEFCSYEEYENATLTHVDSLYVKKTKEECQSLCDTTTTYHCRGYSVVPLSENSKLHSCFLHSEDTKVHGPKLLTPVSFAKYYEKARCLNVSVSCTEKYITVKYQPEINFLGKIYMQGYSEHLECFTKGNGKNMVILNIPLCQNLCGITEARTSFSNRTLLSAVMIVQYNAFIQTQGDRVIRVGCIFGNDSRVLLGTGVNITSSIPNRGSTVVNSSSLAPVVKMRVVDYLTQKEATDTQIGQELQMIIEIKPANGPYDIWAGHLIAMTEYNEESIILLDDRGCPTNLNVFPSLTKIRTSEANRLVATFQAFKFSSSPIVKFSVIVQFCPKICPTVDCGNKFHQKAKRELGIQSEVVDINTSNSTSTTKPNGEKFSKEQIAMIEELPLEFVMVVRNPRVSSDKFIFGENRILIAGYDPVNNEVCLDYSLLLGIGITWILMQVVLVICCALLIRRYKKNYEQEMIRQSVDELHRNFGLGFSNLDARRVHWADDTSLT